MNHLQAEKSPYLLQHTENPVDWYPWGDEAFQRAEREDKPVFLSIGYSTCHWCHVMAHESFEDEEVAVLLNRNYICVKVDREERPDIDSIYMAVCQGLTGSGGWPLTVVMTPQQKPFFAGAYFPKRQRYGSPGLLELLARITELWQNNRPELLRVGERIAAALSETPQVSGEPGKELPEQAYRILQKQYDPRWGGFGSAPKFPAPHNLLFLMKYARLEKEPEAARMAKETLEAIHRGGMYDHIGGGFSRYSTDEKWLVPHFEKMLYDNALLAIAYLEAFQITGRFGFEEAARGTLEYIRRELRDPLGGFYCGQDADSDGVEGKYYVFTPEEIEKVLGEKDGKEFCSLYGITASGNFEGKSIPNRIGKEGTAWPLEDGRLKKLYEYRRERTALHKDDKILLSWNGWAIIAFAKAGRILESPAYLEFAKRACQFVETRMTGQDNRLFLRWRDGEAANAGQLDDYAVYTLSLLELYASSFDPAYLSLAALRAGQMLDWFEDVEQGGFYLTASDAEVLISRPKEVYDGAVPSGNSAAAMALERLAKLTGEERWRQAADRQFRFLAGAVRDYPAGHSFALTAMLDALYPSRELICAGAEEGVPEPLADYLRQSTADNLSILIKTPATAGELEKTAPFTASYPLPEKGDIYYLCQNGACSAPVQSFGELNL